MKSISLTITGLVVLVVGFLGERAGVPFATGQLEAFIETGLQIVGLIVVYAGRIRQGDVNLIGIKK